MNILHLSDIHFGRDNPLYGINDPFEKHDEILNDLIKTVAALDESLQPQHIVVTGDIAWHGKRAEFARASKFFKELLSALNLKGSDITFCVGNHDVDWSCGCVPDELNDDSISEIDNCYKYENINAFEPAIHAYNEFCEDVGMLPYAYPANGKLCNSYSVGYKDVSLKNGNTIRLIALNTSMLLTGNNISEDKLWLGQPQLVSLMEYGLFPADESIHSTIVLYHHSDHYLHPNEISGYNGRPATFSMLMSNSDLMLCGHSESSTHPRMLKLLGGGMLLSGGASYYNDKYVNTFSMVYLSDENKHAGFLSYVHDENGWHDWDYLTAAKVEKIPARLISQQGFWYVTLELSSNGHIFQIPIASLNIQKKNENRIEINNENDFMNPIYIEYEGPKHGNFAIKKIDFSLKWRFTQKAIQIYRRFIDFYRFYDPEKARWQIHDSNESVLFSGQGFPSLPKIQYSEIIMHKLETISEYFDISFDFPVYTYEEQLVHIDRLYELIKKGYTEIETLASELGLTFDMDSLRKILAAAKENNEFFDKEIVPGRRDISNIRIYLEHALYYCGPYEVDINELIEKTEHFCEGDLRRCTFRVTEKTKTYIIINTEKFEKEVASLCQDERFLIS